MDQALPPPPHHRRHGLLIPDGPRETPPHPLRECTRRWELGLRLFVTAPARTTARLRRNTCHLLYGRPLRYSLVIVAAYNQNNITSCFVMNIGCTSRGPTIRVVCGDLLFIVTLLLCCCVRCTFLCVCTPSVRGADTTDRSRRMYMRWSLVCLSCLLLPLPSVCWCCGRAVCVCVPVAVDWSVCRAWCAACGACLAAALSSCGVPSVCVSATPLVSPVALHVPHCADQPQTTE
ncbi:hypothetical protein ECC02_007707 [Trypanosoma cruzi]|uniref:Mucin TcMUC n=1 Tax=Trypanosoma cruzi TaxID=5693 RepID=A0A7J6XY69_TRYCR|nr:hypothetical protein ECC02_007707 [Trypanosoma cruzi]